MCQEYSSVPCSVCLSASCIVIFDVDATSSGKEALLLLKYLGWYSCYVLQCMSRPVFLLSVMSRPVFLLSVMFRPIFLLRMCYV